MYTLSLFSPNQIKIKSLFQNQGNQSFYQKPTKYSNSQSTTNTTITKSNIKSAAYKLIIK
jgi:CRISPR/Cas system CSM-associated protein Csm4 (group 5 of RAMP superfamily)